jgi:hypothetical protein
MACAAGITNELLVPLTGSSEMFSGTKNKWLVLVVVAALAAFVIACGTDETPVTQNDGVGSQPGQNGSGGGSIIADSQALETALELEGADVEFGVQSEFAGFFGLRPTELKVNGESLLIYEFAPGTSAEEASEGVSPDGITMVNPDGSATSVFWAAPPHFYLFGNSILLYNGNDAEIGALLGSVSVQFAGRDFEEVSNGSGSGSGDLGDPPPSDPSFEVVEALAPIESVEILTLESYPEQFIVQVTSSLPNGCASYSHNEVTQDGTDIKISVYNTVPAPGELIACTEIYRLHDQNIGLGSDFERGTTYTVLVNDHPGETFTIGSAPLPSGATPPAPEVPVDHELVTAPIESLEIIQGEDSRGRATYSARVAWGLSDGCKQSYNRTISRIDETTFEIKAIVTSPTGDVMCTLDYRTDSDDFYLGAVGEALTACTVYHIVAGKLRVEYQAIAPNVRCVDPELTPSAGSGGGSIIADSQALELSLESKGADVEFGGASAFSKLFGVAPSELKVNGQAVQIYQFAPGTSAEEASESVSPGGTTIVNPDGSVMSVMWIAPPHFYLFGNAIILYVGNDPEIGALLDSVAGKFAGSDFEDAGSGSGEIDNEYRIQTAQIVRVDIASTRSIPAQHMISMTIALGGSCEEFAGLDWRVEGREVIIDVTTKVPTAPVPCTLAIIYEDQSVNIGDEYETGVEYDVIVNGERQGTFIGG